MAEQRFERDLRALLAADLDPVRGPHPRWAEAPAARRIASSRMAAPRWQTVALVAAAAVGVVALIVAVAVLPREQPVASAPPATIEPWPSSLDPAATPTIGEVALGRVAVATAFGEPALLVRVSDAGPARDLETGQDGMRLHVEVRVVGRLDREAGLDRFVVLRGGRPESPDSLWIADPVGFPIAADAPVGTEASADAAVFFDENETVDLGWLGSGSSVAFRYAVHRPPPVPSLEGRCPTLEDYALASLQPSVDPAPPSFEPVAPDATPSTGMLAPGETGIVAAPDGSPGALIRVSSVRFCDRLPDYRPDSDDDGAMQLLLADVEIESLEAGALPSAFIPGKQIVVANYGGRFPLNGAVVFNMPGANMTSTLETGPGFSYRGTVVWQVPDTDIRVTLDAQRAEQDADGTYVTQFSYLAREGTDYTIVPGTPTPTTDPVATPTTGQARPGDTVVLPAAGGTMPLVVDGIAEVPRYPGLAPATGAGFLEARLRFGPGSGTFTFDPAEWVVVGPDGETLPELEYPREGSGYTIPRGWPNVASSTEVGEIAPDWPFPLWIVAEVPATGRVTLEHRPAGGPAVVSWLLRE